MYSKRKYIFEDLLRYITERNGKLVETQLQPCLYKYTIICCKCNYIFKVNIYSLFNQHSWCKRCALRSRKRLTQEERKESSRWSALKYSRKPHVVKRMKKYYDSIKNTDEYKQKKRNRMLKREYGITLEEYNKLFLEQGGVCKICKLPPIKEGPLVVDHDHTTKKIRGLLHRDCNSVLGLSKDSIEVLRNAAIYLEKFYDQVA